MNDTDFSDLRPWLLSSSIANLTTRGNVLKSRFVKNLTRRNMWQYTVSIYLSIYLSVCLSTYISIHLHVSIYVQALRWGGGGGGWFCPFLCLWAQRSVMYVDDDNTPTSLWQVCHTFFQVGRENVSESPPPPPPPARLFQGRRSAQHAQRGIWPPLSKTTRRRPCLCP